MSWLLGTIKYVVTTMNNISNNSNDEEEENNNNNDNQNVVERNSNRVVPADDDDNLPSSATTAASSSNSTTTTTTASTSTSTLIIRQGKWNTNPIAALQRLHKIHRYIRQKNDDTIASGCYDTSAVQHIHLSSITLHQKITDAFIETLYTPPSVAASSSSKSTSTSTTTTCEYVWPTIILSHCKGSSTGVNYTALGYALTSHNVNHLIIRESSHDIVDAILRVENSPSSSSSSSSITTTATRTAGSTPYHNENTSLSSSSPPFGLSKLTIHRSIHGLTERQCLGLGRCLVMSSSLHTLDLKGTPIHAPALLAPGILATVPKSRGTKKRTHHDDNHHHDNTDIDDDDSVGSPGNGTGLHTIILADTGLDGQGLADLIVPPTSKKIILIQSPPAPRADDDDNDDDDDDDDDNNTSSKNIIICHNNNKNNDNYFGFGAIHRLLLRSSSLSSSSSSSDFNHSIRVLDLSHLNLKDTHAIQLFHALYPAAAAAAAAATVTATATTTILPRQNAMASSSSSVSSSSLSSSSSSSSPLEELNLSFNNIDNYGIIEISKIIPYLKSLRKLSLKPNLWTGHNSTNTNMTMTTTNNNNNNKSTTAKYNSITNGGQALLHAMEYNTSIEYIDSLVSIPQASMIRYYTTLNRAGRRIIVQSPIPTMSLPKSSTSTSSSSTSSPTITTSSSTTTTTNPGTAVTSTTTTTIDTVPVPLGLWPLVLARAGTKISYYSNKDQYISKINSIYYLLRNGPVLFVH